MSRIQRTQRIVNLIEKVTPHHEEGYRTYLYNETQWLRGNLWENGETNPFPNRIQYLPLKVKPVYIMRLKGLYKKILTYSLDLTEYETILITKRIDRLQNVIQKRQSRRKENRLEINEL